MATEIQLTQLVPEAPPTQRDKSSDELPRFSYYETQLILLVAALYASLILMQVVTRISYVIGATLAAIALLAVGFVVERGRSNRSVLVGSAIALMHVAWISFALYFTGALNSPLLPLLYVVVIIYTLQRDPSQTGLVLGGALLALFSQFLALGIGDPKVLLMAGGHAVPLTAASWAVAKYMGPLYQVQEMAISEAAEYQHKYQVARESSEDAVLIVDPQWQVQEANAAAKRLLRNGHEVELTGKDVLDLLQARNPEGMAPYQEQVLAGEVASQVPLTIIGADGQEHAVLFSALPISEDGSITAIQVSLRDVSNVREFRREIKHLEKFAAARHVLSGVGHSLNNPLAIIRLGIQVVQTLGQEPDQDEIMHQVDRCRAVLRGLDIYTAGRHNSSFVTDVNEVLQQATLLTSSQLMMTGVQLEVDVPPNLPLVHADPHSIQRSFVNILTNAWEAMEDWPGPRKLSISARPLSEAVEICFRDTGPGVNPEEVPQLLKGSYTAEEGGMGLGLSVVYDTVQHAGGRVIISPNRQEGGTLVKIILRSASEEDIQQYEAIVSGRVKHR